MSRQGAGPAVVEAAGDVVEGQAAVTEVACGEARFDGRLSPAEPVEGGVDVVGGGVADAEFVGEGGGLPVAWHGQLGAGKEDARGDKGQGELPLWRRPRGEQGVKAQGTDGAEDGADMAVGAARVMRKACPAGMKACPWRERRMRSMRCSGR